MSGATPTAQNTAGTAAAPRPDRAQATGVMLRAAATLPPLSCACSGRRTTQGWATRTGASVVPQQRHTSCHTRSASQEALDPEPTPRRAPAGPRGTSNGARAAAR
eukprot:4541210-Prymnesium_polylepis.1